MRVKIGVRTVKVSEAADGVLIHRDTGCFARSGEKRPRYAERWRKDRSKLTTMNTSPSPVLLHTEGFAMREELTAHAEAKADKLLRHSHPRVHRVRINVKRHTPHSGASFFAVRATAENEGPDHIVHADGAEPETAINEAMHKLERALAASAGARKHRMHRASLAKIAAV